MGPYLKKPHLDSIRSKNPMNVVQIDIELLSILILLYWSVY